MFTMQRYLQPDDLQKHKLHHFDGWAATFGEPVTAMELAPDGAGLPRNTLES
jgi:N12 class adenine-specific DNA methylase